VDRPIAWQVAPLPRVRADQAMLQQVWTNLLDNAVKYSGKVAAPRIEVGTRRTPSAGSRCSSSATTGGFDMRYVDKLFGVFQRLHGPAEFEGTGIGLANVRRIILRHGGPHLAEGVPGQGATFYFPCPPSQPRRRMNVPPILLAEDNPNDVELILAAFKEANFVNEIHVARMASRRWTSCIGAGPMPRTPGLNPPSSCSTSKCQGGRAEVLRHVRTDPGLRHIPSSSSPPRARKATCSPATSSAPTPLS